MPIYYQYSCCFLNSSHWSVTDAWRLFRRITSRYTGLQVDNVENLQREINHRLPAHTCGIENLITIANLKEFRQHRKISQSSMICHHLNQMSGLLPTVLFSCEFFLSYINIYIYSTPLRTSVTFLFREASKHSDFGWRRRESVL